MSYATERAKSGRRPLTIVEIELDAWAGCNQPICETTGKPNYGTPSTCKCSNGTLSSKVYRFCEDVSDVPFDLDAIPSIQSLTIDPTVLDPGKTLGIRAKATINIKDHPYHDRGVDPFVTARSYNPEEQGTYWGKLVARNPFYAGRPMRIISGYVDDDGDFQQGYTRHYVIDRIEGPDSRGNVQLIGKDILKLADDKQAQCPKPSKYSLTANMDENQLTFSMDDAAEYTAAFSGVGTNPPQPYVIIGSEIMRVTSWSGNTANVLRAQLGTEKATHNAGDTVQICQSFDAFNVVDMAEVLIKEFTDIPDSYINKPDWDAEKADFLNIFNMTGIVTRPTGVVKLLNEICEQGQIVLYQDERIQKIILKSLVQETAGIKTLTKDIIVKDSLKVKREPDKQISRIELYTNRINSADDVKKIENYQRLNIRINGENESTTGLKTPRSKVILGRFLTDFSQAVTNVILRRVLSVYASQATLIQFQLDATENELWTGDLVFIDTVQDTTGEPKQKLIRIIKARPIQEGTKYEFVGIDNFDVGEQLPRIAPSSYDDITYASATPEQKQYAFIGDNNALLTGGVPAPRII